MIFETVVLEMIRGQQLSGLHSVRRPFQNIVTKECYGCCFRGFTQVGVGTLLKVAAFILP
jgi:hypothetical protein